MQLWPNAKTSAEACWLGFGRSEPAGMALFNLAISAAMRCMGAANSRFTRAAVSRLAAPMFGSRCSTMDLGCLKRSRPKFSAPFLQPKASQKNWPWLSHVYGMTEQSAGAVFLYSEQGYGTVIEIWLLTAKANQRGDTDLIEARSSLAGLEVLAVEDDGAVRACLVEALLAFGCDVSQVASRPDVLRRRRPSRPGWASISFGMRLNSGVSQGLPRARRHARRASISASCLSGSPMT